MFGEQFYPTPIKLAKEIIINLTGEYLFIQNTRILDPSAGSGAFFDAYLEVVKDQTEQSNEKSDIAAEEYKKENGKYPRWSLRRNVEDYVKSSEKNCYAIEIDPDLQSVIIGKGYKLIDRDFLSHGSKNHYNLVLMNPPFNQGAKHLLRAWETVSFDKLACILNAETVRNPYTKERQLLASIIESNGFKVEYKKAAFSDADRKTNVDIAVIYMAKENQANLFDPIDVERLEAINVDEGVEDINSLAKSDVIGNLVLQYEQTLEEHIEFRRAARKMAKYEKLWDWNGEKTDAMAGKVNYSTKDDQRDNQEFIDKLTQAAWNTVFRLTKMEGRFTSEMQKQFDQNRVNVGTMAFNEENIYTIIGMLIQNTNQMMTDCVLEVYDKFTRYHKDNTTHIEGWKTNDAYEIGPKVVLPGLVKQGLIEVDWGNKSKLLDIDKAMCFADAKQYEKIVTINKAIEEHMKEFKEDFSIKYSDKFESEYFICKVFKKGTLHLKFKDEKLRARFNRIVAKERGWLKAWQDKYAGKFDIVAA